MRHHETVDLSDRFFVSLGARLLGAGETTMRGWFQGRLFNASALAGELSTIGTPQLPTVIAAYRRWGASCLDHFDGDYAFALFDPREQTVFAARDPGGSQPLYYSHNSQGFMVSGSLASTVPSPEIDAAAVASWLDECDPQPHNTLLTGIHRLPPGYCLSATPAGVRTKRFWQPETLSPLPFSNAREIWEAYSETLQTAIRHRLGPVGTNGAHVSGGMDSSAIGAWATRLSGQPIPAFAWQPPPVSPGNASESTEHRLLRAYAEATASEIEYCPSTPDHILEVLRTDGALHPWTLATIMFQERTVQYRAQQRGISHLFSGWGGDEIASYAYGTDFRQSLLQQHRWADYHRIRPASLRKILRELRTYAATAWAPEVWSRHHRKLHKLRASGPRSLANFLGRPILGEDFALTAAMKTRRAERTGYLHPDLRKSLPMTDRENSPSSGLPPQLDLYLHGHLATRIEACADSGQTLGLHYHYPLLDRRVMEFALRLPLELAVHPQWTRWAYRNAIRSVLPSEIVWHNSKLELVRVASSTPPLRTALATAGRLLRAKTSQPNRAYFIDMPALLCDLEPDALERRVHFGKLIRAVSLLDF